MNANSLSEQLIKNEEEQSQWEKGEKQPNSIRDPLYAILFLIHVIIIGIVASLYSAEAIDAALHSITDPHHYAGYIYATMLLCLVTLAMSYVILRLMLEIGQYLIKAVLGSTVLVSLVLVFFQSKSITSVIIGLIMLTGTLIYTYATWNRIPIATANLKAALSCIRESLGIVYVAFFYVFIAFLWTLLWLLALIGAKEETKLCNDKGNCGANILVIIPFVISYFWTFQVLRNSVWVVSAGVVERWWHDPEDAEGCCSPALKDSFVNSIFYSFGSICYGSLITPYVQTINEVINPNGDRRYLSENCCSSVGKTFARADTYFNQWGYVYAGLYGYSFNESAGKAMKMFEDRRWTKVVSDHLVRNLLYIAIFGIGVVVAEFAVLLANNTDWFDDDGGFSPQADALFLGFCVGILFSSLLFSIIQGTVFGVIVLFAEKEQELGETHPDTHADMVNSYSLMYPDLVH